MKKIRYELIHIGNYLVVVSNEQLKHKDFYITDGKQINYCNTLNPKRNNHYRKIIAHLPLNGEEYLDGVDVLPNIEVDVNNLAKNNCKKLMNGGVNGTWVNGFTDGYNEAKQTYKYTEDDLVLFARKFTSIKKGQFFEGLRDLLNEFQQPILPIAFECEMFQPTCNCSCHLPHTRVIHFKACCNYEPIIQTITNTEGRTQWVGTCIK